MDASSSNCSRFRWRERKAAARFLTSRASFFVRPDVSGGTNRLECFADVSITGNGSPDSVTCDADGGGRRAPVEAERRGGGSTRARVGSIVPGSIALTERVFRSGDSDDRDRFVGGGPESTALFCSIP